MFPARQIVSKFGANLKTKLERETFYINWINHETQQLAVVAAHFRIRVRFRLTLFSKLMRMRFKTI